MPSAATKNHFLDWRGCETLVSIHDTLRGERGHGGENGGIIIAAPLPFLDQVCRHRFAEQFTSGGLGWLDLIIGVRQ